VEHHKQLTNLNTHRLKRYNQLQTLVRVATVPCHIYFDVLKQLVGETTQATYESQHTSFEPSQSTADLSKSCDSPLSYLF
jgi:hypothetical protein